MKLFDPVDEDESDPMVSQPDQGKGPGLGQGIGRAIHQAREWLGHDAGTLFQHEKIPAVCLLAGSGLVFALVIQGLHGFDWSLFPDESRYLMLAGWGIAGSVLAIYLARLGIREYHVAGTSGMGGLAATREQPYYDSVTRLPTRRLFGILLDQALSRAVRQRRPLALLLLDLEQIKVVTVRHGSVSGDSARRVLAARIRGCLRKTETVARLKHDGFAVLLEAPGSPKEVGGIAQKILQTVVLPMTLQGEEILINCSIGIAYCPTNGRSSADLMTCAEEAMRSARSQSSPIVFGSPEFQAEMIAVHHA